MPTDQADVEILLDILVETGAIDEYAKCPGVPNYDLFLPSSEVIQIHIVQ